MPASSPTTRPSPTGPDAVPRALAAAMAPRRVDVHAQLARPAADDRDLRDVVDLGDGVAQLRGQRAQLVVSVSRRPESDRHDRHVVDRPRLDDRAGDARRNAIGVRGELLVEPDERGFLGLADHEPDDHHRLAGRRRRVDVLHAGHFPDELFERPGHALLDLRRRGARHRRQDVDHRDDDLRLLFARQRHHRQRSQRQRGADDQGGQLRVDEGGRQPARRAVGRHHRPPVLTRRPSVSAAGGFTITTSRSDRPARTSVPLTFTRRTRAMSFSTTKTDVT